MFIFKIYFRIPNIFENLLINNFKILFLTLQLILYLEISLFPFLLFQNELFFQGIFGVVIFQEGGSLFFAFPRVFVFKIENMLNSSLFSTIFYHKLFNFLIMLGLKRQNTLIVNDSQPLFKNLFPFSRFDPENKQIEVPPFLFGSSFSFLEVINFFEEGRILRQEMHIELCIVKIFFCCKSSQF